MSQTTGSGTGAAFNKFAKTNLTYDLMRGGTGTPWENRGEHGPVGAFLKSAWRAIASPGLLFDHIRSTTVTADAQTFLWICAACWGAGIAIFKAVAFFRIDTSKYDVDPSTYLIASVVETIVAVGWAYAMFRFIVLLYHKLVITEIKQAVPATLTFNVASYAMGPSFLAPIPVLGPPLAALAMFISLVAAGRKRLFVGWRGAIIDALLPFGLALILTVVLYFVGGFVLGMAFDPVNERPQFDTKAQQILVPAGTPTAPAPGQPVTPPRP